MPIWGPDPAPIDTRVNVLELNLALESAFPKK